MEPIHQAARDGDVAAIDRLVAEDGGRLNAQIQGGVVRVSGRRVTGCSPLMLAAYKGHDAAVARLLELGADVGLQDSMDGHFAAHWACTGDHSSVLALLLDAGASINACTISGVTALFLSAIDDRPRCVELLIGRGSDALDLDATAYDGSTTPLCAAVAEDNADIVRLLLQAGADPTIPTIHGRTPLQVARHSCRAATRLGLEAALIEPQRTRALFKARFLLDAGRTVTATAAVLTRKGVRTMLHQDIIAMAVPHHVVGRVAQAQGLPGVAIQHDAEDDDDDDAEDDKLADCLKYALGLEGGGGVVLEGQKPAVGMLPEVFVELLEMMVPKWDPAQKGRPLGEGYIEVEEEEGESEEESEHDEYDDYDYFSGDDDNDFYEFNFGIGEG